MLLFSVGLFSVPVARFRDCRTFGLSKTLHVQKIALLMGTCSMKPLELGESEPSPPYRAIKNTSPRWLEFETAATGNLDVVSRNLGPAFFTMRKSTL